LAGLKKYEAMSCISIYERSHGMRAADLRVDGSSIPDTNRWSRDFFPAKQTAKGWELDLDSVAAKDRKEVRDYYERCGAFTNTAWQRAPVQAGFHSFQPLEDVPDVIPAETEGMGGALIWVNLDRREFVDPAAMGDTPDLAGVMTGMSARAVLGMIVHHERRGGGDLGDLGPISIAGRWRGDRIVLLGAAGFKPPQGKRIEQDEVRRSFVDATANAEAFIQCGDWFDTESFTMEEDSRSLLTPAERQLVAIAMRTPAMKAEIQNVAADSPLQARIVPPTRILKAVGGQTPPKGPIDLAPSFDLYLDGGKIFLDDKTRAEINEGLQALPRQDIRLTCQKQDRWSTVICPGSAVAEVSQASNHQIIGAHMAAA